MLEEAGDGIDDRQLNSRIIPTHKVHNTAEEERQSMALRFVIYDDVVVCLDPQT